MPITATVTIAGDEIIADFTESSPMVQGALNSTPSFIQACVCQAVRSAVSVEVPNTSELPSMISTTIGDGDVYAHRMAGGGGWGDPLEREPERVAADVADGKVSAAAALADYGVVVGEDGTLDADRTRAERDGRR